MDPRKWDQPPEKTVTMTVKRWKMFMFMSGLTGALLMLIAAIWI